MGGADAAQQFMSAGLLDEIQIHLVPVLLGDGVRLFDRHGTERVEPERTEVIEAPGVTHLRFRVARQAAGEGRLVITSSARWAGRSAS